VQIELEESVPRLYLSHDLIVLTR